jgi:hypothetical protein
MDVTLELGAGPANEDDLAQSTQIDYARQSMQECLRYKEQINSMFLPLARQLSIPEGMVTFHVHTDRGHEEIRREVVVQCDTARRGGRTTTSIPWMSSLPGRTLKMSAITWAIRLALNILVMVYRKFPWIAFVMFILVMGPLVCNVNKINLFNTALVYVLYATSP